MIRSRPLLVMPLLAVLAVTSASCDLGGSQQRSLSDGLVTRSSETGQAEMTAIVGGTLVLDSDRGCILLSGKPVVWPSGTEVTTDPPRIHLSNGLTAASGDAIRGTGGEVPAAGIRQTTLYIERDLNGEPRSRIEGDLSGALDCADPDTEVVVFTARGDAMSVSTGT